MQGNPYNLAAPFAVSFSGGRTSAFMLRQILDAQGGSLPGDARVVFANTGREHPATLDFVDECARRWGVRIDWVEYDTAAPEGFKVVNSATAARNGEPFSMLIAKKRHLPNAVMRFCTAELKVNVIARFLKSVGMTHGTMVVGLRADEPRRVHKVHNDERNGFDYACPMYFAGHDRTHVMRFWSSADFDLKLPHDNRAHGNCDLCFLKGRATLEAVIRDNPRAADWWIAEEDRCGRTFRNGISYRQTLVQINTQPILFPEDEQESVSCSCTD